MAEVLRGAAAARAAALFGDWQETPLWSCLQGRMGAVYVDDGAWPRAADARLGDFDFLGGDAGAPGARALVRGLLPPGRRSALVLPQSEAWEALLRQEAPARWRRRARYATRKDTAFGEERLRRLAVCPAPYRLAPLDEAAFGAVLRRPWSRDLVSQFADYGAYAAADLGVVALRGAEVVAGASGYSVYDGGIEIEIDTREDCRRQGLATACAARLILECLRRGLYPSWDAAHLHSLRLAEKLGYRFARAYACYELGEAACGAGG